MTATILGFLFFLTICLIVALIIAMEMEKDTIIEMDSQKCLTHLEDVYEDRNFAIFANFTFLHENTKSLTVDIKFDGITRRFTLPKCSAEPTRKGLVISKKYIRTCNENSELYRKIIQGKG